MVRRALSNILQIYSEKETTLHYVQKRNKIMNLLLGTVFIKFLSYSINLHGRRVYPNNCCMPILQNIVTKFVEILKFSFAN